MAKVMFYCQHILGMGHLIRSIEIVRGLISDFQICFINGGKAIAEFEFPPEIEVVHIPALQTDKEFQGLYPVDNNLTIEEVKQIRRDTLLQVCDRFKPDILIVELFPFGRKRFSFELLPLLNKAKAMGTKIVSSVRDILVTKPDRERHEAEVCRLINKYFELLLVHGDPNFVKLDLSFSRLQDLNCDVVYTGYVTQPLPDNVRNIRNIRNIRNVRVVHDLNTQSKRSILVTVGGGRFGHDLLECVVETAPILRDKIPHHIQVFTGPFAPEKIINQTANHNRKTR